VSQINYNASADFLFFRTHGGWRVVDSNGVTQCEPTYVQITNGVIGRDKILSLGLAAKLAESNVQFYGECHSDPNYFNATYIVIQ
jgi:hypothetical protein